MRKVARLRCSVLLIYIEFRTVKFFARAEYWLANSNFRRGSRMQGTFKKTRLPLSAEGLSFLHIHWVAYMNAICKECLWIKCVFPTRFFVYPRGNKGFGTFFRLFLSETENWLHTETIHCEVQMLLLTGNIRKAYTSKGLQRELLRYLCVGLELINLRGVKNFNPRSQNRILVPLRGSFQPFRRAAPSIFIWQGPRIFKRVCFK